MEAQGYPIHDALFHQDNESAIKMEQNGKASCGQRSRHIDIRYFFITDHSKRNCIRITHCPTENMLADFFTKPLQGALFRKFRSVLLGEEHTASLSLPPSNLPKERVGEEKTPSTNHTNPDTQNPMDPIPLAEYHITKNLNPDEAHTHTIVKNKLRSHSIENYPED